MDAAIRQMVGTARRAAEIGSGRTYHARAAQTFQWAATMRGLDQEDET